MYAMQFTAGFITCQMITNGLQSIKHFLLERLSMCSPPHQNQNHDQLEDVNQRLHEYTVTLSSGEEIYILAHNGMDAAYSALELSEERHSNLINVRITDEWQEEETLLSK